MQRGEACYCKHFLSGGVASWKLFDIVGQNNCDTLTNGIYGTE